VFDKRWRIFWDKVPRSMNFCEHENGSGSV
jgi:hypothetical protein